MRDDRHRLHRVVVTTSVATAGRRPSCPRMLRVGPTARTALLAFGLATSAATGGAAPAVRTEVDALLSRLQASSCEFGRNGSWYSAAEARTHLARKLEYLDARNAIRSTEQFIALGASTSSRSGQPYLVRCPPAPAVESSVWLSRELERLRAATGAR